MTFTLKKAERKRVKTRIGISGPSGSGKTYSALLLAYGLVGDYTKIAVIDTEVGSSNNYSHLGEFNVLELSAPFEPERFVEAIHTCEEAGMEAIIIDSSSHEWEGKGGCLELVEKIANAKFKGNTWAAWSEITPRHQAFIEAIVQSKAHIIVTSRSKTETAIVDGKPKKVGLKDIQREGFEYELTLMFNIDRDTHLALASKDRTSLFIDKDPFLINEKTGQILKTWTDSGVDPRVEHEKNFQKILQDIANSSSTEVLGQIYENFKNIAKNFSEEERNEIILEIKNKKYELATTDEVIAMANKKSQDLIKKQTEDSTDPADKKLVEKVESFRSAMKEREEEEKKNPNRPKTRQELKDERIEKAKQAEQEAKKQQEQMAAEVAKEFTQSANTDEDESLVAEAAKIENKQKDEVVTEKVLTDGRKILTYKSGVIQIINP